MKEIYESYSEDALLQIGTKYEHLTEEAQKAYIEEIDKRGIDKSAVEKHKNLIVKQKAARAQKVDEGLKDKYQLRTTVAKALCFLVFLFGVLSLITQDDKVTGVALIVGAPVFYICYLFFTIFQKKIISSILKVGSE